MTDLLELQRDCRSAFTTGDIQALSGHFVGNRIPAATRVKVYENNLRETYRKALSGTYPVVEQPVGAACFSGLARLYVSRYPSKSGDLQNFGAAFDRLLEQQYGATPHAYLADVARLERAIEAVLLEAEDRKLEPAALAALEPGDLAHIRLRLARSLRIIASPYPVLSIWKANQPGQSPAADLGEGAQWLVILRHGDEAEIHRLDRAAFELAVRLARDEELGAACDDLAAEPDLAFDAARALGTLLRIGCIASLSRAGT